MPEYANPESMDTPHCSPGSVTQEAPLPLKLGLPLPGVAPDFLAPLEARSTELAEPKSLASDVRFVLLLQDAQETLAIDLGDVIYTIGRAAGCSIRIQNKYLSRHHAYLVRVPAPDNNGYTYSLFDGGREDNTPSRNGVFVNGQRVKEHILKPGDVIHFGPGIRATFYPVIRPVSSDAKSEGSSEETELEHLQDPDPSGTESGS